MKAADNASSQQDLDAVIEAAYRHQIDPRTDPYTGPYVPIAHFDVIVDEVERLQGERDRAVGVLREVNDCCPHDWIDGVSELLDDREETT